MLSHLGQSLGGEQAAALDPAISLNPAAFSPFDKKESKLGKKGNRQTAKALD